MTGKSLIFIIFQKGKKIINPHLSPVCIQVKGCMGINKNLPRVALEACFGVFSVLLHKHRHAYHLLVGLEQNNWFPLVAILVGFHVLKNQHCENFSS